jgi:N-methylhydantoinase B
MTVVDPITFEVVQAALRTVTAEAKWVITRTAYSGIVATGGDLSVGIANIDGKIVAQGRDVPVQLGALPYAFDAMLDKYGGRLRPGDVLIGNHPYECGANHINDVSVMMPAFLDDQLLGYAANRIHWTDMGGHSPGSYNVRVFDMYGEGLLIPPVRIYTDYEPVPEVWDLIFANVRGANEREWDLRAAFAGCIACERGLQRLARRYSPEILRSVMNQSIEYSERRMRARISEIPDGEYHAVDWLEGDGWEEEIPVRIEVTVRIHGSDIEVDWSGSAPQVRGGVNLSFPSTAAVSVYAIAATLDSDIPPNDGLYRLIKVTAPEGSVVNPTAPAPCQAGVAEAGQRAAELLMMALAKAVPEKVIAGTHASSCQALIEGPDLVDWRRRVLRRTRVVTMDQAPGGMGARASKDGISGIKVHTHACMVQPVEVIELNTAVRITRWERVVDTGGAGRQRGGCAVAKEYESLADDVTVTTVGGRNLVPPFGLAGGRAGATGQWAIDAGSAAEIVLPAKNPFLLLKRGQRLLMQPAGSGGYGPPWARPAESVRDDVLDGYVSAAAAASDYGVVLNDDGDIDREATAALRGRMIDEDREPATAPGEIDPGVWSFGGVSSSDQAASIDLETIETFG